MFLCATLWEWFRHEFNMVRNLLTVYTNKFTNEFIDITFLKYTSGNVDIRR